MPNSEFRPSLFHPYYFIRRGLLDKINEYKHVLKGRMLDFGCGSKPYKTIIQVDEYIGLDYENEGHSHINEQIDVFYDGKTIPFEANHFDTILSSEVFEHVFNLEEVLRELHRVLKPGGEILITCPFVWKEHEMPNDYARYTHFALKHLFEKNGFTMVTMDKSGHFIQVIFQLHVLYFFDHWYPKFRPIPVVNALFRLVFFAFPNLVGSVMSRVFSVKQSLYFNNIIIARKNAV